MNSMDKNQQSSQNELDLGLNQEPITPKKTIQPSSSILGKTKGLFAKKIMRKLTFSNVKNLLLAIHQRKKMIL